MSSLLTNNRGFSIVEVLIAAVLTTIGVLALVSMQPLSWRTAAQSDLLGKAAGILQTEMERAELFIMNSGNTVVAGTTNSTLYPSGETTSQAGDVTAFNVQTDIVDNGDGSWTVTTTVTWPQNKSLSESIIVTRQEGFNT